MVSGVICTSWTWIFKCHFISIQTQPYCIVLAIGSLGYHVVRIHLYQQKWVVWTQNYWACFQKQFGHLFFLWSPRIPYSRVSTVAQKELDFAVEMLLHSKGQFLTLVFWMTLVRKILFSTTTDQCISINTPVIALFLQWIPLGTMFPTINCIWKFIPIW